MKKTIVVVMMVLLLLSVAAYAQKAYPSRLNSNLPNPQMSQFWIKEGAIQTVTVNKVQYQVEVLVIGSVSGATMTKLRINGAVSPAMKIGDVEKLAQGFAIVNNFKVSQKDEWVQITLIR